jgi:LacI family transcriptional regulator
LRDLALAAGVSKSLASRALANYPDVAVPTRERVARLAAKLGYRPSARARALARGKHALARCAVVSLGITPAALGRTVYGPVLTGIAAQASLERLDVHLVSLDGAHEQAADMLAQLVAEDRADGLVLLTFFPLTPADVRPLDAAGVPYVLVNRHFGARPVNCVALDWAGATRFAVEHLASRGHRRLALLLPEARPSTVLDHEAGWREGLGSAGIAPADAPIWHFLGHDDQDAYRRAKRELAPRREAGRHRPTAIVCMNDGYAHAVLTAATEAGIAVPRQLSVIGFDNIVAPYLTPPLCSFDPHLFDVGVTAATLLATALRGQLATPRHIVLPLDFICRASCGPAPE